MRALRRVVPPAASSPPLSAVAAAPAAAARPAGRRGATASTASAAALGALIFGGSGSARTARKGPAAAPLRAPSHGAIRAFVRAAVAETPMEQFIADASKPLRRTDARTGRLAVPDAIDLVIYHGGGCPDGFASAFAAWLKLGDRATYVPAEHGPGWAPPDVNGRHVAVVDFSFDAATTGRMIAQAASFVVLDHHASALGELAGVGEPWKVFSMEQSGATLAWDFFHGPDAPVPPLLRYVEDKDLWRWALTDSAALTAGLATVPQDFAAWAALVGRGAEGVRSLIARGSAIVAYKDSVVEGHVRRAAPARLRAAPHLQALVVNASTLASEVGNALATLPGVDVGVMWTYEHAARAFRVSLRSASDAADVAAVAKALGGGGHRRAAGFSYTGAHVNDLLLTGDAGAPEGGAVVPGREAAVAAVVAALPSFTKGGGGAAAAPAPAAAAAVAAL
jgi:uncharacterized protein